jgi:predicted secreted protein
MKALMTATWALAAASWLVTANAQDEPRYDLIDLGASVSEEVENDLLIAFVFAEVEASDQADAADEVNEAIAWAADRARRVTGVDVQTTNYNTRPVYANGRRIVGWVARQSLRLQSTDAEALSELLGDLQQRVAIQSIDYGLSDAARDAAEEALIAKALAQFNRRADLIVGELDRDGFRIVRINIGTQGGNPIMFARQETVMRAGSDSVAAPEIAAGKQMLTVSVNGTIELEPGP